MKKLLFQIFIPILIMLASFTILWLAYWAGVGIEANRQYEEKIKSMGRDTLKTTIFLDTNKTDTIKWKI